MRSWHINTHTATTEAVSQEEIREALAMSTPETSGFFWIDISLTAFIQNIDDYLSDFLPMISDREKQHIASVLHSDSHSFYEQSNNYQILRLRLLDFPQSWGSDPLSFSQKLLGSDHEGVPITHINFLILDHAVVTLHDRLETCSTDFANLLASFPQTQLATDTSTSDVGKIHISGLFRTPITKTEFIIFFLSALINRYQSIRLALTVLLDQQQRELLLKYQPTLGWKSLLEARITLRFIESIGEEQIDCLDDMLTLAPELNKYAENPLNAKQRAQLIQEMNRLINCVERILQHSRRMEASIETAVQIHFSATSNHTNDVMRLMTIVMLLFLPLTALSGLFGMNFAHMPLINNPEGFWYVVSIIVLQSLGFIVWYCVKRFWKRNKTLDFLQLQSKLKMLKAGLTYNKNDKNQS